MQGPRRSRTGLVQADLIGTGSPLAKSPNTQAHNLIERQPWDRVAAALARIGVDDPRPLDLIKRYCAMVIEWNRGVSNLISRNDEGRIVVRHVLESLDPARLIVASEAQRLIDFGSGAGFPALPLALAGVGQHWILVESRRPKTLFIRRVIQDLGVKGVEVIHGRLEALIEQGQIEPGDGFTSRATLALPPTLSLASSVVITGGSAFLWKGSGRDQEMASDDSWRHDWALEQVHDLSEGGASVAMFKRISK